jgi:hypothetical protein
MNNKYLFKALCILTVLTAPQVNAALLQNPTGPGYDVVDFCHLIPEQSCNGATELDVHIQDNVPIVLEFDASSSQFSEYIDLRLVNETAASWSSLTIEYTNILYPDDLFDRTSLILGVWDTGTSGTTTESLLYNPSSGATTGIAISFLPPQGSFVVITGDLTPEFRLIDPYTITITTSAVPVPAAVWLFGSGLLGLIGVARRKKA